MQVGDLVCSKSDLSQGHIEPLGMITNIEEWARIGRIYTRVYVLLFKSKTVNSFNMDQLIKLEDVNYEQGYKNRGQGKA